MRSKSRGVLQEAQMDSEIQKLQSYFLEAEKQWPVNPEFVISHNFYEIWEDIYKPEPFPITDKYICLNDEEFTLPDDKYLIGCFIWDNVEECCCLTVEGEKTIQKIPSCQISCELVHRILWEDQVA